MPFSSSCPLHPISIHSVVLVPFRCQHPRLCLTRVSLAVPRGELTVIVGEVGAGKSSLLAALAGELAPLSGRCEVCQPVALGT